MPVPPKPSSLIRGLKLLEHLSSAVEPVRFSDLRDVLSGATDATLSRLLQMLEGAGYVERREREGYVAGPSLECWMRQCQAKEPDFGQLCERSVQQLSMSTNESAGFVLLEVDHLSLLASCTAEGAVSIAPAGSVFHIEADHAASLAVLSALTKKHVRQLIRGPYSRIASVEDWSEADQVSAVSNDPPIYLDRSRQRPGICRMATPVQVGERIGALFLCLTVEQARTHQERLQVALVKARDGLMAHGH